MLPLASQDLWKRKVRLYIYRGEEGLASPSKKATKQADSEEKSHRLSFEAGWFQQQ
jgi:hypothetical protein